jgi:hypothetical protein
VADDSTVIFRIGKSQLDLSLGSGAIAESPTSDGNIRPTCPADDRISPRFARYGAVQVLGWPVRVVIVGSGGHVGERHHVVSRMGEPIPLRRLDKPLPSIFPGTGNATALFWQVLEKQNRLPTKLAE